MKKALLNLIMQRRSVRHYTEQKIPHDVLETICRAALAAPSARNRQMRQLIVITERATLDALEKFLPNAPMLKTAQAALVVCGEIEDEWACYWEQDCSASVENALLAAEALELGACWCGLFPREERAGAVARELGVPASLMPMALLTLGYPVPGKDFVKDKWKPEKIHWEKF